MTVNTLLRIARTLSLGTGFVLSFLSQKGLFTALLTGPGSLSTPLQENPEVLHGAADATALAVQSGAFQFVTGIAFFIVGLLIHALIGVREEREVRIRVVPKKKTRWFWMEIRI